MKFFFYLGVEEMKCFKCEHYKAEYVPSGSKKGKKNFNVGYCSKYKKGVLEISPFVKESCEDYKEGK